MPGTPTNTDEFVRILTNGVAIVSNTPQLHEMSVLYGEMLMGVMSSVLREMELMHPDFSTMRAQGLSLAYAEWIKNNGELAPAGLEFDESLIDEFTTLHAAFDLNKDPESRNNVVKTLEDLGKLHFRDNGGESS